MSKEIQNLYDDKVIKREISRLEEVNNKKLFKNIHQIYKNHEKKEDFLRRRQKNLKRIKIIILTSAFYFKKMSISIKEFFSLKCINANHPFLLKDSEKFMAYVKEGNYDLVEKFLLIDKSYGYIYDYVSLLVLLYILYKYTHPHPTYFSLFILIKYIIYLYTYLTSYIYILFL